MKMTAFIFLLCIVILQYGFYENLKNQRDNIEKNTELKYEKKIKKINDNYYSEIQVLNKKINQVSVELDVEKQKIKDNFKELKDETTKVIVKSIYSDCKLSTDGMHLAEKARIAANTGKFTH